MKQLTKSEEQIMQILWEKKKAFVKDIIKMMPEPKPAYNTVSTIVRILETKNFISHQAYGKSHEYFPIVDKSKYTKFYLNTLIKSYFNGSFQNLVSFFANETHLDEGSLDEILKELNELKESKND